MQKRFFHYPKSVNLSLQDIKKLNYFTLSVFEEALKQKSFSFRFEENLRMVRLLTTNIAAPTE